MFKKNTKLNQNYKKKYYVKKKIRFQYKMKNKTTMNKIAYQIMFFLLLKIS